MSELKCHDPNGWCKSSFIRPRAGTGYREKVGFFIHCCKKKKKIECAVPMQKKKTFHCCFDMKTCQITHFKMSFVYNGPAVEHFELKKKKWRGRRGGGEFHFRPLKYGKMIWNTTQRIKRAPRGTAWCLSFVPHLWKTLPFPVRHASNQVANWVNKKAKSEHNVP